jgi:D-sedoheptulose 7-phosphate isomerase
MTNTIENMIEESIAVKSTLYLQVEQIKNIAEEMISCFERGNKILLMGNGGSAADAQHIAGELVGRFKLERQSLPAISLSTDTSIITAWSNDYEYDTIFSRQIEALTKPKDILFGLSTSGNSKNIIKAFEKGKELNAYMVSLTGNDGGRIKHLSDLNINVYSENTPRIQESHVLVYHILCELIEEKMFGEGK